ncbi:MAG: COG1361 S-layer family protein [Candidatus Aenigmatarchaeota archaeon]
MRKIAVSFALIALLMASAVLAAEPLIQATFSPNPAVASPGNDGYFQLAIKNSGTVAANSVKISRISPDLDIIPSGDWVSTLSSLGSGDSATSFFKFHVAENASSGLRALTFYIDYGSDSGVRTINPNLIVSVQSPSKLELTTITPSSLTPSEKTNMIFTIANKGDSSISNAIFTWTSADNTILPLGSDNRVLIPVIGVNSEYSIPVEVAVSPGATPGVYPLSIVIQYPDKSGAMLNISSIAGIKIGGGTDFDVSLQDYTSTSISLTVANIGINAADSITISAPEQQGFAITGATSVFLGSLSPGDYTMVTFNLASMNSTMSGFQQSQMNSTARNPSGEGYARGSNATAQNALKVQISYTDTAGFRQVVQKEIQVKSLSSGIQTYFTQSQRSNASGIWLYVGAGAVLIAAVAIYFKFFRRKKK